MTNLWYYIAFTGNDSGLYAKFEKKGFTHCFIFYPVDGERLEDATMFSVIEHNKTYVQVGLVAKEHLLKHIGEGIAFRVKSNRSVRAKWWWWIPTPDTCVTICKQVLGVQKPFMWSPYQLYRHLIKEHKWEQ